MATITGSGGVVKVADAGGTLAAVAEVRSFSLEHTADTLEVTSMGTGTVGRSYVKGLDSSTLSVECYFDTGSSQDVILEAGNIIDFELSPEGTGVGTVSYSGEGIVASVSVSSAVDGLVEVSFSVTVNNGVTKGTN